MTKLLKILLVWLCVLSLPVQGMAAVTKLACGSSHHHLVKATHAGHGAGADHAKEHAKAHASASAADKCSVCASCCTGLGLLPTVGQWPLVSQQHAALIAIPQLPLPSFVPDGLERPPRPTLA